MLIRNALNILVLLLIVSCTTETTDTMEDAFSVATEIGLRNVKSLEPGLILGGQPTVEQLEALEDAGVHSFISLRPEAEDGAGWEENYTEGTGTAFSRLPISGVGSLTKENVETFARLLNERNDETTVLYCASGNRVGAMLALKSFWVDGIDAETSFNLGVKSGMTSLTAAVGEMLGIAP
jgi:protein tyrosine phosphatase (PTP) superfamily phosphohydrolase (DUF442 family)